MTNTATRTPRRPSRRRRRGHAGRPGVGGAVLFAVVLLALFLAIAFAAGYGIGKLLI